MKKALKKETEQLTKCIVQASNKIKKLQVLKKTSAEKHKALAAEYQNKASKALLSRVEKAKASLGKTAEELKSSKSCLASCKEKLKNITTEHKKFLAKEKALATFEKHWLIKQTKKPKKKRKK